MYINIFSSVLHIACWFDESVPEGFIPEQLEKEYHAHLFSSFADVK